MIPTRIEGCTRVLGAPVGWTPETSGPCVGLPIRDDMNGDVPCTVSSWEPTPAELRAIAAGGKVYLRVLGAGHPPVMIYAAEVADLAPAAPSALERAIAELETFERDGTILCEIENEVSFTESIALCLHELKRLRAAAVDRNAEKTVLARLVQAAEAIGFQAGVGERETAGAIVSYLATSPDEIAPFVDGSLSPVDFAGDWISGGCLSWHAADGRVVRPSTELKNKP